MSTVKRCREPSDRRRPVFIWSVKSSENYWVIITFIGLIFRMADSLKQAIGMYVSNVLLCICFQDVLFVGMIGVHFVNLFLSQLLPLQDIDHCIL